MQSNVINLILTNKEENNAWIKEFTYDSYSPRHDHLINFIRASEVAEKSNKLDTNIKIRVRSTATVSEVIAIARECYTGYDKDWGDPHPVILPILKLIELILNLIMLILKLFQLVKRKQYFKCGYPIKYSFYYPALSDRRLDDSEKISDLGIVDGDLVVISQDLPQIQSPPVLTIAGVSSFKNFQHMVWGSENPHDPMLLATLLYTDSDIDLAKYVREHFDEIHQMSGPRVIVYVIEYPVKDSDLAALLFWKNQLDIAIYRAWSLLGWTRSKPYDKNAAYEIASSLGIYPDQLPCLVVFDKTDQAEKIIIPVNGDYTTFFRNTFSNIQRALNLGPGPDIYDEKKLNIERFKLFEIIRKSLNLVQEDLKDQYTSYNINGQTIVFINHPTGPLHLDDFQNTKQVEENKGL